jgi:secondary thiamine-phosphate synthase enzyme
LQLLNCNLKPHIGVLQGRLINSAIPESFSGLCVVYVPHTTAGVTINEGADPDVISDIIDHLRELVPNSRKLKHVEGNSDAHIKSSLIGSSVTVIVSNGKPLLGTWQKIFFAEFDGPRKRKFWMELIPKT